MATTQNEEENLLNSCVITECGGCLTETNSMVCLTSRKSHPFARGPLLPPWVPEGSRVQHMWKFPPDDTSDLCESRLHQQTTRVNVVGWMVGWWPPRWQNLTYSSSSTLTWIFIPVFSVCWLWEGGKRQKFVTRLLPLPSWSWSSFPTSHQKN